jgi:hypothetical protein
MAPDQSSPIRMVNTDGWRKRGLRVMRAYFKPTCVILSVLLAALFPLGCDSDSVAGRIQPIATGTSVTETVTPETGGTVQLDTVSVDIAPGALSRNAEVKITSTEATPMFADAPEEVAEAMSLVYPIVGKVYDIDVGGQLQEPATLTFQYSEGDIPEGFSEEDLIIVRQDDGEWHFVETTVDAANNTVSAMVSELSIWTFLAGVGVVLVLTAGTILFGVLTQPAMVNVSWTFLTPQASNIKGAVADGSFVVDVSNGQLLLKGKTLVGKARSRLVQPKTGEEMFDDPEGMCEDFSNLFGSLLIAAGYPVRIVSGHVTYPHIAGNHAWAEVVIGGKLYYVDTVTPDKGIFLVPMEEAVTKFTLKPGKTWGRTAEGDRIRDAEYDPAWPLLGKWQVKRTGFDPEVNVPALVVNRVAPSSEVWEVSRRDGELHIDFAGRNTWFKSLGVSLSPDKPVVTEAGDHLSFTFDTHIDVSWSVLPSALMSIVKAVDKDILKVESIGVAYDDEVRMSIAPDNKVTFTVRLEGSGQYTQTKTFYDPEREEEQTKKLDFGGRKAYYDAIWQQ